MGKALCLTFVLSLFFPQWAIAQQPIAPVPTTPFGDGQDFVLTGICSIKCCKRRLSSSCQPGS